MRHFSAFPTSTVGCRQHHSPPSQVSFSHRSSRGRCDRGSSRDFCCRLPVVHLALSSSVSVSFVSLQPKEEVVSKRCHYFSLPAPLLLFAVNLFGCGNYCGTIHLKFIVIATPTCVIYICTDTEKQRPAWTAISYSLSTSIHTLCENIVGQSDGALLP